MSGGRFDYQTDRACDQLFDYSASADYGMGDESYLKSVKCARALNPCEDKMLSELVYDVFCLLHSLDWYLSGDTGEDTYLKDVKFFKKKWLKAKYDDIVKSQIDKAIEEVREDLYKTFLQEEKVDDDA